MQKGIPATWEDIDDSLKEISEYTNQIAVIEAELSEKVTNAQKKARDLTEPLKEKIKIRETQIKDFTETHRDDLSGKSKKLNFGQVGFRKSVRIEFTDKVSDIINALKKYKMRDCIDVSETVNKNSLKKYSDQELENVGAKRVEADNFYIKL